MAGVFEFPGFGMPEAVMGEYGLVYLLIGAILILGIGLGMLQVRRKRGRSEDPHSGLTEVEEARRKMQP